MDSEFIVVMIRLKIFRMFYLNPNGFTTLALYGLKLPTTNGKLTFSNKTYNYTIQTYFKQVIKHPKSAYLI